MDDALNADAPDADADEAPDDGEADADDPEGGGETADSDAPWGVGVFVVTPAGEAALVDVTPGDAATDAA